MQQRVRCVVGSDQQYLKITVARRHTLLCVPVVAASYVYASASVSRPEYGDPHGWFILAHDGTVHPELEDGF